MREYTLCYLFDEHEVVLHYQETKHILRCHKTHYYDNMHKIYGFEFTYYQGMGSQSIAYMGD